MGYWLKILPGPRTWRVSLLCNRTKRYTPSHSLLGSVTVCPKIDGERIATHDCFRNGKGRLGRRAGEIYELLYSLLPDGMTDKELAEQTGAHIRTVSRALDRLKGVRDRRTGEYLPMVSTTDGMYWTAEIVELDLIAAIFHTYGKRGEQRERYEEERADHRKSLEKGAIPSDGRK